MNERGAPEVRLWADLPSTRLCAGLWKRASVEGDFARLAFNWIEPGCPKREVAGEASDHVILTLSGRQMIETRDGEILCEPETILRIPRGVAFSARPAGDEPVVCLEVTAASESTAPAQPTGKAAIEPVRWAALPRETLASGLMHRSGFRGDRSLVVFNSINPAFGRPEPHSHPFDQLVLTVHGRMMFEIEGQAVECPPRSIIRVPGNLAHTGRPLGDGELLNVDVFAPMRDDYGHLVKHQAEYAT